MRQKILKGLSVVSLGVLLTAGLPSTAIAAETPTFGEPTLSSGTVTQNITSKAPVVLKLNVNGPATSSDVYSLSTYKTGSNSGVGPHLYSPIECNAKSDKALRSQCKGAAKTWGSIYGNGGSTIVPKLNYSKPVPLQTVNVELGGGNALYPGKYKVVVPVNKLKPGTNPGSLVGGVQKNATGYLTVNANAATSKKLSKTTVKGSWDKNYRYRPTVTAQAPDYQAGAKATFYFKAAGAKSYANVGTATTNRYGVASLTPAQNKNLAKGGHVYVTFDAVKFSPKFSTAAVSFTKKQAVLW